MNKAMKEVRMNQDSITNLPESRKVEGYAVVFQSESNDLGGFKEVIDSRALDGIIEKSDVLCLLNHNEDKGVLARSNKGTGSLTLEVDEKGLKYSFEAPNTALGDEVLEGIRRVILVLVLLLSLLKVISGRKERMEVISEPSEALVSYSMFHQFIHQLILLLVLKQIPEDQINLKIRRRKIQHIILRS